MNRDIITIEDLSNDEILTLFKIADEFLDKWGKEVSSSSRVTAVRGRQTVANDFVLATLFYEPSTRTRLSFESAMLRLGGQVVTCADAANSSAVKGETIADTVRVVETYADAIVIRHPAEGAARVAADFAEVPVINAGDGGHEHPTQTLCDLYTLYREKGSLANLSVLICGDLKNGRTVHSLVFALARFGGHILTSPAPGLGLPDHVIHRLITDYQGDVQPGPKIDDIPIDAVYQTPERSHQLALIPDLSTTLEINIKNSVNHIDVCYVTRFQKERSTDTDRATTSYPKIDRKFLNKLKNRKTSVLHPLPRVDELGYDVDGDRRALYFQQAAYGVPMRMALLAALLKLRVGLNDVPRSTGIANAYSRPEGIRCANDRCVTNADGERRHLVPSFLVIDRVPIRLRCKYCEHETVPVAFGNATTHKYYRDWGATGLHGFSNVVFFGGEAEAESVGFVLSRARPRHETPVGSAQ
jgi:aspartate carbamoyltransferase catalytic subunit